MALLGVARVTEVVAMMKIARRRLWIMAYPMDPRIVGMSRLERWEAVTILSGRVARVWIKRTRRRV